MLRAFQKAVKLCLCLKASDELAKLESNAGLKKNKQHALFDDLQAKCFISPARKAIKTSNAFRRDK
ncbi:hypothetical protein [Helicobacter sp. T3_23-1059]